MVKADRRFRGDGRTSRVVHVPLTDVEFRALRRLAWEREQTMGDAVTVALQRTYNLDGGKK